MKPPINPNELDEDGYAVYLATLRYERDIAPYPQTMIGSSRLDPVAQKAHDDKYEADTNFMLSHFGGDQLLMDIHQMARDDAKREIALERMNLSLESLTRLLAQVHRTCDLVSIAKEQGSSLIPVSQFADPCSDALRETRDKLIRSAQLIERVLQRKIQDEARRADAKTKPREVKQ